MRSVSVGGFELFGSFVVIAAQPKETLCFVVDKSPEVTLCGWRGYKPSFNKQTLLISFVLLLLPTGRPFSWLVVCCRLWSITLTDTSSPRRMKGKARTLLILFLYMFLRVRVWASPLHELPFPYKDTVEGPAPLCFMWCCLYYANKKTLTEMIIITICWFVEAPFSPTGKTDAFMETFVASGCLYN